VHLNILEIPKKYFIDRWKLWEKKDIRDLRYNVPMQLTEDSSQLRFSILSTVCINIASDGSKSNEMYMFVSQEVKKIAEKLDEMTIAEDAQKEANPENNDANPLEQTEYGHINDSRVVKSKGRPTTSGKRRADGRFKTFAEQNFTRQQVTCSHCG
jgi:hypothetical protein